MGFSNFFKDIITDTYGKISLTIFRGRLRVSNMFLKIKSLVLCQFTFATVGLRMSFLAGVNVHKKIHSVPFEANVNLNTQVHSSFLK